MPAAGPPVLRLSGVSKAYPASGGASVQALRDVSLEVGRWEFISLVGPSGCGKSTLLGLIAGLDDPSAGSIEIAAGPDGATGEVAFMPQRDLLLPWRTTLQNAVLGPELRGEPDREARALAQLDRFGLEGFADAYPHMLSGGMRQRIGEAF